MSKDKKFPHAAYEELKKALEPLVTNMSQSERLSEDAYAALVAAKERPVAPAWIREEPAEPNTGIPGVSDELSRRLSTEAAQRAIARYDILVGRLREAKPDSLMKKAVKERKRKAKWNF